MKGLAIGENFVFHANIIINAIGYPYFNFLIILFFIHIFLCIIVSAFTLCYFKYRKKRYVHYLIVTSIFTLLLPYILKPDHIFLKNENIQRSLKSLPRIAHAGGGYQGHTYTNSINALNHNAPCYDLFELDFSWTSDNHLVCLHDWDVNFQHFFGADQSGPVSLGHFLHLVKKHPTFEKCTMDTLIQWLEHNTHARIVTDVKEDNIRALKKIAEHYPDYQKRFIPQVYQPWEYYITRRMGYDDVILTLYAYHGSDEDVLFWIKQMDLYGLAMPRRHADRGLAWQARETTGVLSWVHTINTQEEFEHYLQKGISNIYTDWLVP